ncbi:hypothetical protein EYR36_001738 [Pleurotus pulmonarius]|nr:hypothetical protein EYR36_008320 [Pleurotus pulmonarius]KAF4579918.1 hypothetical protein EYR36_001738 [Pleurotus pulmonarius]
MFEQWAKIWELPVLDEKVVFVALHPDSALLAISYSDFKVLSFFTDVPLPKSPDDVDVPVEVTSVSWLGTTKTLVVSYLHHGVVGWDVSTCSIIFSHAIENEGGSLSPDGDLFAALSPQGITVIALPLGIPQQSFGKEDGREECARAIFIHNGYALFEGRKGRGIIWDISTSKQLAPDVKLEDGEDVCHLAQHYNAASDLFRIAITTSTQRLLLLETHQVGEPTNYTEATVGRPRDFRVLTLFSLGAAVAWGMIYATNSRNNVPE